LLSYDQLSLKDVEQPHPKPWSIFLHPHFRDTQQQNQTISQYNSTHIKPKSQYKNNAWREKWLIIKNISL
jgi:hypothetical protein